jgi:hypothetical protein
MQKKSDSWCINRRMAMALFGTAIPALAMTTEARAGKMSQRAAKYQDSPKNGKKCGDCKFFKAPHSCSVVDGNIDPEGWCLLWQKA